MTSQAAPIIADPWLGGVWHDALEPQHWILVGLIILELLIFSFIGPHFLTLGNLFDILRINVELGLVALAMTLVIITGGIDLSVGSLMALSVVVFGKLWRDEGMSPVLAAGGMLLIGVLAGGLNALLITRLRIPPLIVTLGSYSLFRGIAEGMTGGMDAFTHFPRGFLLLGNGYFGVPILVLAIVGFWLFLHRSIHGRALVAIGYSPDGARYAGIRVDRRLAWVYILSGFCAALAGLIYAARIGQAKADAGTGYELLAITAVVLGGTSIFGGRGSIIGTMLGLLAIGLLHNGLRLAGLPGELADILSGVMLLVAIGADWRTDPRSNAIVGDNEELDMRNSQLAVLSAVILAAALIVAGGNWMMLNKMANEWSTRGSTGTAGSAGPRMGENVPTQKKITIAMMPKSKGNAYFIACNKGAMEAARELNVDLLWDGPTDSDSARQNEIVETWITRGVDVIAVSVENRDALSTALRKAREKGIKVVTWDADAQPDARDFLVNQATPQGIGQTLMDDAAASMGGKGSFAIITASLTAANQNEWIKYVKQQMADKYPDIKLVDILPCDDQQTKAFEQSKAILNAHPEIKLLMAVCSPGVPGAAEAVEQSGRKDVKVVGLGLPNENKKYVHDGVTDDVILWNTMDLGYLTVYASDALAHGTLKPGDTTLSAGRLGKVQIQGDNVMLGKPFSFTKANIDQFDF